MQYLGLLLIVIGAGLVILSRERRISAGALAAHYLGITLLLAQHAAPEIVVAELALGGAVTALFWLSASGRRRAVTEVVRVIESVKAAEPTESVAANEANTANIANEADEEPMSAIFQALTLAMCLVAAISLASTYRVSIDPETSNLNLAFFWLTTVGLLALGITRRPLSIGGGLLFLFEAVQIAYLIRTAEAAAGIAFGLATVQLMLAFGVTRLPAKSADHVASAAVGETARLADGAENGGAPAVGMVGMDFAMRVETGIDGERQDRRGRAVELGAALGIIALLAIAVIVWDVLLSTLILTAMGLLAAFLLDAPPLGRSPSARPVGPGATMQAATMKALALVTFAGICLQVSVILAGEFQITRDPLLGRIIVGLAAMGLMAFFGAFPFHSWLFEFPRRAQPWAAAAVVAAVNFGALAFFAQMLSAYPWLLADSRSQMALMVIGILGYAISALISVTRRDLVNLAAYAAIGNAGLLLAGVGTNAYQGLVGGAVIALNQSVALLLLLLCVRAARREEEPGAALRVDDLAAVARERPFLALGILLGSLTLIGVPPFAGFLGRWLVFLEISRQSAYLTVLVVGVSLISIFSFVPVFRGLLSALGLARAPKREPAPLKVALLSLSLVPLAVGLYPAPILAVAGEVLRTIFPL